MSGTLVLQEAVNLMVGDGDVDNSKHLNLASISLPNLEEVTAQHHAGGSIGEIEVGGLGIKALQPTFKINGWDPQVMRQFGLGSRVLMPFTVYGLLRDKLTGDKIEVKAVIRGRMTKLSGDAFKRGDLMGHDHSIQEVMHYELYYNGEELYYFDFKTSLWRVGGVIANADERAALRIS